MFLLTTVFLYKHEYLDCAWGHKILNPYYWASSGTVVLSVCYMVLQSVHIARQHTVILSNQHVFIFSIFLYCTTTSYMYLN